MANEDYVKYGGQMVSRTVASRLRSRDLQIQELKFKIAELRGGGETPDSPPPTEGVLRERRIRYQRSLRDLSDAVENANRELADYKSQVRNWITITSLLGVGTGLVTIGGLWIPMLPGYGMIGVNIVLIGLFIASVVTTLIVVYPGEIGTTPTRDMHRKINSAERRLTDFIEDQEVTW